MFLKGRIRFLLAMLFVPVDSAISSLSTEVDDDDLSIVNIQTVPAIQSKQLVFVCDPVYSSAGTVVCGLVEAGQLTFIGAEQGKRSVLVNGSLLVFRLYPVQGCYRHYAMVFPNPLDEHFTDSELAAHVGLSVAQVREGFPVGTCRFQTEPQVDSVVTVSVSE